MVYKYTVEEKITRQKIIELGFENKIQLMEYLIEQFQQRHLTERVVGATLKDCPNRDGYTAVYNIEADR